MKRKSNTQFQMIADYDGDLSALMGTMETGEYPILATRNLVLFPTVISPILVGREASVNLIEKLKDKEGTVFAIFCQKDQNVDNPQQEDLYETGVFAKIVKVMEMPGSGANTTAIVQGLGPCKLVNLTKTRPYYKGIVEPIEEVIPNNDNKEFNTLIDTLKKTAIQYIRQNDEIPDESEFALKNIYIYILCQYSLKHCIYPPIYRLDSKLFSH